MDEPRATPPFTRVLLTAICNRAFLRRSTAIRAALKYGLQASNLAMPDDWEAIETGAELVGQGAAPSRGPHARQSMNRILDPALRDLAAA